MKHPKIKMHEIMTNVECPHCGDYSKRKIFVADIIMHYKVGYTLITNCSKCIKPFYYDIAFISNKIPSSRESGSQNKSLESPKLLQAGLTSAPKGDNQICKHCKKPIKIRNPSGYCDHLYYPENCETCKRSH